MSLAHSFVVLLQVFNVKFCVDKNSASNIYRGDTEGSKVVHADYWKERTKSSESGSC